jgi:hypothetical protein
MDCEKFETAMIDELYDELDELTSAAAKRHVAGCARCAALYSGLRATRRVMSSAGGIPMVEIPSTLEDRILAATREAQKVVPFRRRFASAISAAGSWAMRPQTQMAAVFLLMIGSSVVFLKGGRNASSSRATAPMTVTEQGAPAASIAALSREESLDTPAANAAHGAKKAADPSPASAASAVAMATATAAPPAGAVALPADEANGFMDGLTRGQGRADKSGALGQLSADDAEEQKNKGGAYRPRAVATPPSNAGAIGGASSYGGVYGGLGGGGANAPATPPAARAPAKAAMADNRDPSAPMPAATAASGPSPKPSPPPPPAAAPAPVAQTVAPGSGGDLGGVAKDAKKEDRDQGASALDSARAAYTQRRFPDAIRQFDALAANGDKTAALWAARSTRDGSGCSAATQRYDTIAGQQAGTNNGNDALLEGGQCYRQVGNVEAARARLVRLLTVASHAARAQRELDAMSPKAAAKPQPRKAPEPSQQQAPSKDSAF